MYSPSEIEGILNRCKSEEEVLQACSVFRWLMLNYKQRYFYLVNQIAHAKLQEIYKRQ